jgi:4-alpha-glucanotransferase
MNADAWGVSFGYTDTEGVEHITPESTRRLIRAALGAPEDPAIAPADDGAIVSSASDTWVVHSPATIFTESGDELHLAPGWHKPADFPLGYHRIRIEGQAERAFIATPDRCALPDSLAGWGWATQLYAMRSSRSWGIGDLGDLATLNTWSKQHGAAYTLVNPLHAATPTEGQQPSPYFPTSRIWRNPLFLRIESIPGWEQVATELTDVVARANAMLSVPTIDRTEIRKLKMAALERLWVNWRASATEAHHQFAAWRRSEGSNIEHYGLYSALVEVHGGDTRGWPEGLRNAHGEGVALARDGLADRVSFHAWQQWLTEVQLAAANAILPVMTDLAIGVDRAGADAWVWPDAFARSMSVGAPPDTFNTQGQNWGLPPFNPWRLRQAGYEPFIRTVRAAFRGAGALRMDHVMGLFRLWWIPEGATPIDGCYVYLPYRDLTGIVALESVRAGLGVVGEDLGTIEPYVSTELKARRILSYKLVQFEPGPTAELEPESMVAVTTHDLPTIGGAWTGSDLVDSVRAGVIPNIEGTAMLRLSLARKAGTLPIENGADADDTAGEAVAVAELVSPLSPADQSLLLDVAARGDLAISAQAHGMDPAHLVQELVRIAGVLSAIRQSEIPALLTGMTTDLATSSSRIVAATLDDALFVEDRPNLPGTTDERPNWRIPLPILLEDALQHPGVQQTAAVLNQRKPNIHNQPGATQP